MSSDDPFSLMDLSSALGGDDGGSRELLAELRALAAELTQRQPSEWYITARRPEFSYGGDETASHSWLATDLRMVHQRQG